MMYTLYRACQLAPDYKLFKPSSLNNTLYGSSKLQNQNVQLQYCTWQKEKETSKNQYTLHNKAHLFKSLDLRAFGCWYGGHSHLCGLGRRNQGLNNADLSRSSRRPRNVVDKPKVYLQNIHSTSSVSVQSGKGHYRRCTIKPSQITYLTVELLFLQNSIESTHCRKDIENS